jgi:tetratricopeptide (TPR) repeat protein
MMKMMRKALFLLCTLGAASLQAQSADALTAHYKAYYQQMKNQGDVRGVINALTHLNVLAPSVQRRDTLAYLYANNDQHVQALNLLGLETTPQDSDIALQVKALSLKSLNQPERALVPFKELNKRQPSPYLLYEIADLRIQIGENAGALQDIQKGMESATPEMKYAFYERQQPYEVSLKAAFVHLRGLAEYGMNKNNIDKAIASFDEALTMDPNFNLAGLSKQALESRKQGEQAPDPQN